MTSRERFHCAMQHRLPDRVPFDLGATCLTGMRSEFQQRLCEALGFRGEPIPANNGMDERVLQWAGTDFRSVGFIAPLPSVHTRQISETARVDAWGVRRDLIGDHWEITSCPLRDAAVDDLKNFAWPE